MNGLCPTCGAESDDPINDDQCAQCFLDGQSNDRVRRLTTLSARVVEAAVREREYERDAGDWNAVEQQCRSRARAAAVDALIAERQR